MTTREVACRGHCFGEDLVCPCGVSWWRHQQSPQPCSLHARRRNQSPGRYGCEPVAAPPRDPKAASPRRPADRA